MHQNEYKITMIGTTITVNAFNLKEAIILAQAEAIKRGLNYALIKAEYDGKTIYYCVVCHNISVDITGGYDTCYNCSKNI